MEQVFVTIFNMSITAGYVILAILLLRLILRRAPKKYTYALWAVAAFRLVCPVSFSSVWSLFGLDVFDFTGAQQNGLLSYVPQDIGMAAQPEISVGLPAVNAVINESLPAATPNYSANPVQIWLFIAACVWVIGMVVLAVYAAASCTVLSLRMRSAVRVEDNVYCSERVRSPFILGIFRPRIYIPYGLPADAKDYVLAHERYHLKRFDHLIKPLAFCIAAVHWFNPLVWVALSRFGCDMELRTDEAVLSAGEDIRGAYSTVLLSFASNRRIPVPQPLAFGESGVKTRIKHALRWQKPKRSLSVVCVCLCFAVMVACAANPELPEVIGQPGTDEMTGYFMTEKHLLTTGDEINDDSGCIYAIGEDFFVSFDRDSGEVLSLSTGPGGFRWLKPELSVKAMMNVFESANVEPLDRDYSEMTVAPMGLDDGIARVEDELWLILMDDNVLTDIYSLAPTELTPENFGFNYLEWTYHGNPAQSNFEGFFLGFDLDYASITVTGENGHLTRFDGLSYEPADGDTLTLFPGDRLVWSPLTDLRISKFEGTPEDTVEITIHLTSGATVEGTLTLEGHQVLPDEPGLRAKFFVRFTSEDLFMRADRDFGGGVLTPVEHHLSVLDYPLAN